MPAPTRELLTYFDELHRTRFDGMPAVLIPGKDAKLLTALWKSHEAYVKPLMTRFFAERDGFQARAGFTVGVFASQFARLLMAYRRDEARAGYQVDWEAECQQIHGGTCSTAFVHDARTVRKPA